MPVGSVKKFESTSQASKKDHNEGVSVQKCLPRAMFAKALHALDYGSVGARSLQIRNDETLSECAPLSPNPM